MNWTKNAFILVLIIVAASLFYSSRGESKLSKEVLQKQLQSCQKAARAGCELIDKYHKSCFKSSYRSAYKVKQFHPDEYRQCMAAKIDAHDS